ncbi:MAG TPA: NAD(P)H nitroreductase [Patescibacteria group bacterium]|nr:NAD(P)H nitroreductase [Patescibacteria group bacterium]
MVSETNAALSLLLGRRSCHALSEPAPEGAALDRIFQAALRVPDFQRLRPFRFIVAVGEGRDRLGQMMQRAAVAADKPDDIVERAPRMPLRAPMVITVAATPKPSTVVPVFDQQLAAGCTVLAMQLAAQAQGFGGVWRSGWLMYDRGFHSDLGLAEGDQIVGFLYLGTPNHPPAASAKSDDPGDFVHWL